MVAVLDAAALTGFHRGLFSVSAEDDCVYLIADAGAIPLPRTRVLTTLDDAELSPIGADWGPMLMAPASPVAVGNTQFEGRLGGLYHGETGKFFIDGAHGLIAGPVVFDMMREVLDSRITFTGDDKRTYFDSSGIMRTAATNAPRFNYRYNGGLWVKSGLLVEPPATNLLVRAREFNIGWSATDSTITVNAANGVDGAARMDLITEGSAGTAIVRQTSATIVANSTNTFAMDLKRGNHDWVRLDIIDPGTSANALLGWFNLATGAKGTASNTGTATGCTTDIINLGNGIYRCIVSGAVNNSLTSVTVRSCAVTGNGSNTRVSGGERYQDRAQLEAGSVATSFIETTTATASRAADVPLISGTNFSNFFNPVEGAFVAEFTPARISNQNTIWTVSDGTVNERMASTPGPNTHLYVADGGIEQANIDFGTLAPDVTTKIAAAYKANDFAVSNDGGAVFTATSGTLPTVDRLYIGAGFAGAGQLNGHVRQLRYLPWKPSNTAIPALAA